MTVCVDIVPGQEREASTETSSDKQGSGDSSGCWRGFGSLQRPTYITSPEGDRTLLHWFYCITVILFLETRPRLSSPSLTQTPGNPSTVRALVVGFRVSPSHQAGVVLARNPGPHVCWKSALPTQPNPEPVILFFFSGALGEGGG